MRQRANRRDTAHLALPSVLADPGTIIVDTDIASI